MSSRKGYSSFPALMKDVVLWWPGLETNEFPVIPSGVTVTPTGTFTKDDLGNNKSVVKFDGSTNYISLSDNDAWDIYNGTLTVSFWFRRITTTEYTHFLDQTQTDSPQHMWNLYYWNAGSMFQLHRVLTGTSNGSWYKTSSIINGNWYFITMVKVNSGTPTIYINGIPSIMSVNTNQSNTTTTFSVPMTIGGWKAVNPTYNKYQNGNIKDLMIFKGRALTQPEIKLLMNRTHPVTGEGLLPGGYDYYTGGV